MPGQTVLIIDDDAQFRADLTAILGGAGYKALEAHDGRSALAALDEFGTGIDLMVVDLCLPENVSGLDVIIDATRRKIPIKIIAASAVFGQLQLDIAANVGADVAIRKPVEGEIAALWLETIRRLLGESVSPPTPSQRLIVLTDDESAVRGFVKSILQHAGYQVLEAADGAAALALIEKIGGALDLLITDYQMPNLNGAELVRAVRAKYPNVPVVYISGYGSGSQGDWLADPAQACALVRKPFLPQQLLEVAIADDAQLGVSRR
jgi:CheY-like chemotaxis protein